MLRNVLAAGLSLLFVSEAVAGKPVSPIVLSQNLGDLLGSEEFCGLTFDQAAIEKFIEDNVSADDMQFAGSVQLYANMKREVVSKLSASQQTVQCVQVKRVAKEYGFIK